jgi:hypothetical protein
MEDQDALLDTALEMFSEEEKPEEDKGMAKDPTKLAEFDAQFETDKDNRRTVDWQWFVIDSFMRGNHFVKWNRETSTIESVASRGVMRFPINKIYSTVRSVRGFVTKYDPKWEVYPANRSDDAIQKARYKQQLLDETWYQDGLKAISKDKVYDGLRFSVGVVELGWDKEEQKVIFTRIDPFDIFFGGGQGETCTRVTKAVKRNVEKVKNDPKYKGYKGEITPEPEEAASEIKQTIEQINFGYQNKSENDDSVIVKETFYVTPKVNSLGGRVNIASYTKGAFLRHIETKYDSLWDVFKIYKSDVNSGETYGEGWVKHLIPVQKMLDILESQTMEYHHMFAKGRYVVPKNSGAKLITSENGIILEHNPGKRPQVENAPSMTASVEQQIQRFNIYLEDIGGQHDASLGRIPTGATAGVAIEALQEGDANNLKDLVENFDMDLVSTARGIFKMYAKYLTTTKIIETDDVDSDGKANHFAIIGEDATNIPEFVTDESGEQIPVCVIRKNEKVRVTIGSWLAYNREALEARVYKHFTAGMIDQRTALDALKYSDPDGIIQRSLKEAMLKTMVSAGPPIPGEEQMGAPLGEEPAGEINTPDAGIPTPPVMM